MKISVSRIINAVSNPKKIILYLGENGFLNWMPDKTYLEFVYRIRTHEKLDLKNPQTFNEKIQWLKLYDRNPAYTKMVDKCEARKYVSGKIPDINLIPVIGVYENYNDIDFDSLPNQFVMKPNHTSGHIFICKDKTKINYIDLKKMVNAWSRCKYYLVHREWPYKNIKPKIIIEKYAVDDSGVELKDYKIFCFHGEPKIIEVDFNRFGGHKRNIYTTNWEYIDASIMYPNQPSIVFERPAKLMEMLNYSRILSKDIAHVRVDFYIIGGEIFFGEMTFYHGSGYENFSPESFGAKMSSWLTLPKRDCLPY